MSSSALPQVDQKLPKALRVVLIAAGLALLVWPAWDMRHAFWPVNALTPFFAVLVMGAIAVGLGLLGFGLYGEDIRWTYVPHMLLVHRRAWGWETVVRVGARDVKAIEVRRIENSEGADTWRVFVTTRESFPGLRPAHPWLPKPRGLESGDYTNEADASAAHRALLAHFA